MDAQNRFPCILRRGFWIYSLSILKTNAIGVVGADCLAFFRANAKDDPQPEQSVPLKNIDHMSVEYIPVNSRRLEFLRETALHVAAMSTLFVVGSYLCGWQRPSDSLLYRLILIVPLATLINGTLYFLFNKGYSINADLARFHFAPHGLWSKPFSLDVEPKNELDVRRLMLAAGIEFQPCKEGCEELECESCGTTIGPKTRVCPRCGADLEF